MNQYTLSTLAACLSISSLASAQILDKPMNGPEVNGTVIDNGYLEGFSYPIASNPTQTIKKGDVLTGIALVVTGTGSTASLAPKTVYLCVTDVTNAPWQYPDVGNSVCGGCKPSPAPQPFYEIEYDTSWASLGQAQGACKNLLVPSTLRKPAWKPLCLGGRAATIAPWRPYDKSSGLASGGFNTAGSMPYAFACPGSALYHCALEWGFQDLVRGSAPGLGRVIWTSISYPLQTCIRALRGDFCGTNDSYTVPDVPLVILKGANPLSIAEGSQRDFYYSTTPEAVWHGDGAVCINENRLRLAKYKDQSESLLAHVLGACGPGSTSPKVTVGRCRIGGTAANPIELCDCMPKKDDDVSTYPLVRPMGLCFTQPCGPKLLRNRACSTGTQPCPCTVLCPTGVGPICLPPSRQHDCAQACQNMGCQ